ncbi:MAG TPA: hypothetical protein O0X42_04615 [Methanocorpusculum sp.]|nr:hypothetical protein [Methanocorpusculum sp.]
MRKIHLSVLLLAAVVLCGTVAVAGCVDADSGSPANRMSYDDISALYSDLFVGTWEMKTSPALGDIGITAFDTSEIYANGTGFSTTVLHGSELIDDMVIVTKFTWINNGDATFTITEDRDSYLVNGEKNEFVDSIVSSFGNYVSATRNLTLNLNNGEMEDELGVTYVKVTA